MTIIIRDNEMIIEKEGQTMKLSIFEANQIGEAVDKIYYREDVMNYFEKHVDSGEYSEAIFKDESVIDAILERYAELRHDADGGEEEDSMHWTECLNIAIYEHKKWLERYKN